MTTWEIMKPQCGTSRRATVFALWRATSTAPSSSRRVDRLIEATPPGYRDRQPDPGVEDATPILIVGMPRSGSTLTEQILSIHPEVAAGGELEFWHARDSPREDVWSLTLTRGDTAPC